MKATPTANPVYCKNFNREMPEGLSGALSILVKKYWYTQRNNRTMSSIKRKTTQKILAITMAKTIAEMIFTKLGSI